MNMRTFTFKGLFLTVLFMLLGARQFWLQMMA